MDATSLFWSQTINGGADSILLVGVSVAGNEPVTSVTFVSDPLTCVASSMATGQTGRSELWGLSAPPVGTANVVVTLTSGAKLVAGAADFFGVNPVSRLGGFVTTSGQSTNASATLTLTAGELVFATAAAKGDMKLAPTGGETQLWSSKVNPTPAGAALTDARIGSVR